MTDERTSRLKIYSKDSIKKKNMETGSECYNPSTTEKDVRVLERDLWKLKRIHNNVCRISRVSLRPQPDGVLLSPLGWCSCLPPFSASHCGNQGISDHWHLPRWGWVLGRLTLSPQAGRWSFCLLPSPLQSCPPCSLCDLSPPHFQGALKVRQQPPSSKTTKITNSQRAAA